MITEIGIVAGEIWQFLEKEQKVLLEELFEKIDRPKELILMSLGWLAREGHVILKKEKDTYSMRLRKRKKGVILIIVMGALVVMSLLALISIRVVLQRVGGPSQKIRSLRAQFALQAGVVDAFERLRKGNIISVPTVYNLGKKINGFDVEVVIKRRGDTSTPHPCPSTAPSDYCIFVTASR